MNLRLVSVVFYAFFIGFAGWYISRLDLSALAGLQIDYGWLAVSVIFALLFRYCGVFVWLEILKGLNVQQLGNKPALSFVYAKAWLGRYLPGKITWLLGKVYFASKLGVPTRKLVVSSAFEAALQTAVILCLSLVLLGADPRFDIVGPLQTVMIGLASAGLLVALTPSIFNRIVAFLYARTKRRPLTSEDRITLGTLIRASALCGVAYFLTGAGYFFFTKALYGGLGFEDFIFVSGVFNLAGAIGVLSLFAPSGLGVREGIQLMLLPLVMPAEVALVVTVGARLWSVGIDLVFFGVAFVHCRLGPTNIIDAPAQV